MTNKEKFMEVMNQIFNTGLTKDSIDTTFGCPVAFEYKIGCNRNMSCDKCRDWWNEEYKEATLKNDDELHKRQWISVKDRLPERCVQVLVTDGFDIDTGNLSVDGWWHLDDSISCDCLGDITHWQPLPEPPKEREENA